MFPKANEVVAHRRVKTLSLLSTSFHSDHDHSPKQRRTPTTLVEPENSRSTILATEAKLCLTKRVSRDIMK